MKWLKRGYKCRLSLYLDDKKTQCGAHKTVNQFSQEFQNFELASCICGATLFHPFY